MLCVAIMQFDTYRAAVKKKTFSAITKEHSTLILQSGIYCSTVLLDFDKIQGTWPKTIQPFKGQKNQFKNPKT